MVKYVGKVNYMYYSVYRIRKYLTCESGTGQDDSNREYHRRVGRAFANTYYTAANYKKNQDEHKNDHHSTFLSRPRSCERHQSNEFATWRARP